MLIISQNFGLFSQNAMYIYVMPLNMQSFLSSGCILFSFLPFPLLFSFSFFFSLFSFLQKWIYVFFLTLKRDLYQASLCLEICSELSYRQSNWPVRSLQQLHVCKSFPQTAGIRRRNILEKLIFSKCPLFPLHLIKDFTCLEVHKIEAILNQRNRIHSRLLRSREHAAASTLSLCKGGVHPKHPLATDEVVLYFMDFSSLLALSSLHSLFRSWCSGSMNWSLFLFCKTFLQENLVGSASQQRLATREAVEQHKL